jgi:hypothetical protein
MLFVILTMAFVKRVKAALANFMRKIKAMVSKLFNSCGSKPEEDEQELSAPVAPLAPSAHRVSETVSEQAAAATLSQAHDNMNPGPQATNPKATAQYIGAAAATNMKKSSSVQPTGAVPTPRQPTPSKVRICCVCHTCFHGPFMRASICCGHGHIPNAPHAISYGNNHQHYVSPPQAHMDPERHQPLARAMTGPNSFASLAIEATVSEVCAPMVRIALVLCIIARDAYRAPCPPFELKLIS